MLLEEVGLYLQTLGLGVLASTLFLGGLPSDAPGTGTPDASAALVETPGLPPEYVHDVVPPSREHPVLQLLVRGAPYDYASARQWANDFFLALGRVHNQTLSGTFYLGAWPLQSPFFLRSDDYSRPIMSFQVRFDKAT
jgi:hypothetical protein